MARVSIYLLGNFQVRVEDQWITRKFRTDKERALLAYLAQEGERPISRETLAELFWPDRLEGIGRTNLRQALLGVRKAIGDIGSEQPLLLINDENIQLNRKASFWLDTTAFSTRFQANYNQQFTSFSSCVLCAQGLQEAVDFYRQDFLDGLYIDDSHTFQEWVLFHREQYQRYYLNMLDHLGEFYQSLGEFEIAQKYAWLHVKHAPLEERAYRRLMETLALTGRRSAAMEQYQAFQELLFQELGVEPSAETTQLFNKIRTGEPLLTDQQNDKLHINRLPRPMTDFYGRESELETIEQCFKSPNCRLVSISGMLGSGKSRLLIEAAQRFARLFPDGVIYLTLDGIRSQELFLPSLGRALGLTISQSNPKAQIYRHLGSQQCLLIIDQFDGMHNSINQLIDLLQNVPSAKLAITSRRRINLQAAHLVQLEGLPYPMDPADSFAMKSPAVRLFLDRAQRSRPGFNPDAEALACVVEICQKVQGMPLALELAADRLRELPIHTIATYLQQGLNVLSTSLQDIPEPHRSMEKALWDGWQMLDEPMQKLLKQLTVFPTSFTTTAAEVICQAEPESLAYLSEFSFLQGMKHGRYTLRPIIRQYAITHIQKREQHSFQELLNLHADYYLSFLHQKMAQIDPEKPNPQMLSNLEPDMPHFRKALDVSLLSGKRNLSVQGSRDLSKYQRASLAVPLSKSGSLKEISEIKSQQMKNESIQTAEGANSFLDLRDLLEDANNAIFIVDDCGQIKNANFIARQLSGHTLEVLIKMNIQELGFNENNDAWISAPQIETHLIHRSGASVPVEVLKSPLGQDHNLTSMYIVRKRERDMPKDNSPILEDPLTHLPNRLAFIEQLRRVISQAASQTQMVGVLVLDIEKFFSLHSDQGLEISQKILSQVSIRLKKTLRQGDFLARLGEDDFGVILDNLPQTRAVQIVSEKLLRQFELPFQIGEESIPLSVTIGAGIYPLDSDQAEALLLFADQARKRMKA